LRNQYIHLLFQCPKLYLLAISLPGFPKVLIEEPMTPLSTDASSVRYCVMIQDDETII
jgi:hypothetical protein